jgi:CO dehydrogenase/acetyl-CoA synthase gamma subunit (corrinoid Fe-S protein)
MKDADLYLGDIDFDKYFSPEECRNCGADSCKALVEKLRSGGCAAGDLEGIPADRARALQTVLNLEGMLPGVPQLSMPRPGAPGLTGLNSPFDGDPILVTGNNLFTQEVLLTVLSTTTKPFFFLSADTRGDSLDMAVILDTFTVEAVEKALGAAGLTEKAESSSLLLPGRAVALADPVSEATGRRVDVGPVCAAELPLFYGEAWQANRV